ncbi:protein HIDE1 isoform X5 [Ambystoma mexicanum]|uniref:protein HIDE1 isoform X5 n=1 Tax=Ambystoma mexicanum TaxID=8296 RepID=UPI0037E7CAB5
MAKRNPINCRRELPLFHTSLRWADCHARAPHPWSRSTSEAMAHPLLLLCLGVVWGATSGTSPAELPAPAISLDEGRPDVEGQPAAARIRCTAPSNYLEGTFFLYREGKSMPVQELGAPESRHSVTFALPGAAPAGHYRCRYNAWVSDKLRGSELSSPLWLNMTGYALSSSPAAQGNASEETGAPAWIVPLSVGGSIALLLVIVLVAVVAVKCVRAARRRKERAKESCWTQNTDISKTNLAYTSSVFEVCMESDGQELPCPQDPADLLEADHAARKRLPSSSHFSTFRT